MRNEATITINGKTLSQTESMTLRVAITMFHMDLSIINPDQLDETQKAINTGYKHACINIVKMME